jgi:hypothetical protein
MYSIPTLLVGLVFRSSRWANAATVMKHLASRLSPPSENVVEHPGSVALTQPPGMNLRDFTFPLGRNPVESTPSSLSAFRLATLVPELTVKGEWPLATLSPRPVAPAPVLVFVTCSALPATGAESEVVELAEFALPRMKFPPVAA